IVSGSVDRTVRLWRFIPEETDAGEPGHIRRVTAMAVDPTGKMFASGGEDRSIVLWDLAKGTAIKTLTGHTESIKALTFIGSGTLASAGADRKLNIWDIAAGKSQKAIDAQDI